MALALACLPRVASCRREARQPISELDFELPYFSKFILLAAYICSRNKPIMDKRLFDPMSRAGKRHGQMAHDKQVGPFHYSLWQSSWTTHDLIMWHRKPNTSLEASRKLRCQISSLSSRPFTSFGSEQPDSTMSCLWNYRKEGMQDHDRGLWLSLCVKFQWAGRGF